MNENLSIMLERMSMQVREHIGNSSLEASNSQIKEKSNLPLAQRTEQLEKNSTYSYLMSHYEKLALSNWLHNDGTGLDEEAQEEIIESCAKAARRDVLNIVDYISKGGRNVPDEFIEVFAPTRKAKLEKSSAQYVEEMEFLLKLNQAQREVAKIFFLIISEETEYELRGNLRLAATKEDFYKQLDRTVYRAANVLIGNVQWAGNTGAGSDPKVAPADTSSPWWKVW